MPAVHEVIVVVGGFAGSGKSTVARVISQELRIPILSSDTFGRTIRQAIPEAVEPSRAGYEMLFTLADEFLDNGCSAVLDMSMGWEFQWHRYDHLIAEHPQARGIPIILDCPRDVCVERIARRIQDDNAFQKFMRQPQLPGVWDLLQQLERPDVHRIDAQDDSEETAKRALAIIESSCPGG